MRVVRAVVSAVLVGALVVTAAGVASGDAAPGPVARAGRAETVTVRGVLERLVVDTVDGEEIRYAVRGIDRTWWLDGLPQPAPAAGSAVDITGTPRDEYTLAVATTRVTTPAGTMSAVAAATPRSTRVLVLRAYWGARPPARPTTATTKQRVITASRAWFQEVSHGRYTVSGSVTPWLKVSRPQDCYGGSGAVGNQALAAAQRAGFRLASYGRFILYLPCSAGGILGYASMPGQYVVLFDNMDLNVVAHEQGHNLGLGHASSRECTSRTWGPMTWSGSCQVSEYGDEIDAMGNRRAGHFNALYKARLGWLQRAATVTSTGTVTLRPYETTDPGVQAIRLRAGRATYWLEYRTRTGADRGMIPGTSGVQIRYQAGAKTQLLDAGPGSTVGYYDFADGHLPLGSSWTTPQNVRITVTRQTSSAATVAIRFGAGAPRPPKPPGPVSARALVNAARISWTRPADNGAIIRRYLITRSDGATRTVTTFAGLGTSYTWNGLSPSRSYAFKVQAINEAGKSAAATSAAVRPLSDKPSITITSPAGGTVQGVVTVKITATPNTHTKAPISFVQFDVDGTAQDTDFGAPWGPFAWDTRRLTNGTHTVRITVQDTAGRSASVARTFTVSNPTPTVTITSPSPGGTLAGEVDVTYSLSPATWDWQQVALLIDGSTWAYANPGEPVSVDPTGLDPGSHTLRVRAWSGFGTYQSTAVNVSVPTPTVTIDSPTAGTTLTGPFELTYTLSPPTWGWSTVELWVDGLPSAYAVPGAPLSFDTTWVGPGPHSLRVHAHDGYRDITSSEIEVTFEEPG